MKIIQLLVVTLIIATLSSFNLHARPAPKDISAGKIKTYINFASEFIQPRNVHVWTPDGYNANKRYPVLYMHDGNMLFDAAVTWNNQEWGVDEVASALISEDKIRPFIVVAIDNIDETRFFEYFPAKAQLFANEVKNADAIPQPFLDIQFIGDSYLKFLVEELKPFIEKNYAVSTKLEDTAIMGSSMGGLISMYAISEYPEEFGMAACVSTHYPGWTPEEKTPIGDTILAYMDKTLPSAGKHKIYYDFGTTDIDRYYEVYQVQVDKMMEKRGYTAKDWMTHKDEGAGHNEDAWRNRLHIPYTFMFGR